MKNADWEWIKFINDEHTEIFSQITINKTDKILILLHRVSTNTVKIIQIRYIYKKITIQTLKH